MLAALGSVLGALARLIGIGGVLFVGLLFYEEGLPGASRIALPQSWPIVGGFGLVDIPVLGDLTAGRVHIYAAQQVKVATAAAKLQCDGRIEKLVSQSELTAANAKNAELLRQIAAMNAAQAAFQKQATADQQSLKVRNEELEKAIAGDTGSGGSYWTTDDLQWLQINRGRAGGSPR